MNTLVKLGSFLVSFIVALTTFALLGFIGLSVVVVLYDAEIIGNMDVVLIMVIHAAVSVDLSFRAPFFLGYLAGKFAAQLYNLEEEVTFGDFIQESNDCSIPLQMVAAVVDYLKSKKTPLDTEEKEL